MRPGLVRTLVRFHLAPEAGGPADAAPGDDLPLRVDHVLAGGRAGLLAMAAFESAASDPPRVELALACADRGAGPATFETPEETNALHASARRAGIPFSRPGHGRCDLIHRERFAAPGKILLAAGRKAPACGALGMLGLQADPLEVAAVLAGGAYHLRWPGVAFIELEGSLAPGVGGHDLSLHLAERNARPGARTPFVEFTGPGVAGLSMADRMTLASDAPRYGAQSALFPSDAVTRAHLNAQGREPEWKALEVAVPDSEDAVTRVNLTAIEPRYAPWGAARLSRRCRDAHSMKIGVIEIGVEAPLADLERMAAMLAGHRLAPGVEMVIVPGSRQLMETARIQGAVDRFVSAGARVLEAGVHDVAWMSSRSSGVGLCFGVPPEDRPVARTEWFTAGPETCVAAARTGELNDARGLELPRVTSAEPERYVSTDAWVLRSGPEKDESRPASDAARKARVPLAGALVGPLRGPVLLTAGDGVPADTVLPWGARLRPLIRDIRALQAFVFTPLDPGFPERAAASGGGFVVAGTHFARGPARDPMALALVALGIRAIMAVSFAGEAWRQLLHAGALPLRFVVPADRDAIMQGDELEIPGLPEAVEPSAPLVVRNLTRGTQFTVRHELNEHQIATVLAGGLLPRAVATRTAEHASS